MKNKVRYAVILALVMFLLTPPTLGYSNPKEVNQDDKNVLFINSYSPKLPLFNEQVKGVIEGVGRSGTVQIEYMDEGIVKGEEFEQNFYNLLKYKIDNYNTFDVIIAGDDLALMFVDKYREDLFKDIPIVFFGVNEMNRVRDILDNDKNVYGVLEEIHVEENVDIISKNHPNKNIVALAYQPSTYVEELNKFYKLSSKYPNSEFSHISLGDDTLEEVIDKLKKLDNDDVLLSLQVHKGQYEDIESRKIVQGFIDKKLNIPKYYTSEVKNCTNFVGGYITSYFNQAKQAGEITKNILNNKHPEPRVISDKVVGQYIFNYPELKKRKIDETYLPKGSIINNKPPSPWEEYQEIIIPTSLLILCLIVVIVVLIRIMHKRREYNNEVLRAKNIAENALKAQNNFIATISHELRTPIAVISSSNQLLEMKLKKYYSEETQNTKIIKQNCYRLTRLINNIIDIAKVESGFMDLKITRVNIITLLENIVMSIVPYANSKNIEVIFDTQEEEIFMTIDPDKIERIVLNLLSNSIKFTNKYGIVEFVVYRKEDILYFEVRDSGIGMDTENLEKIFDKFIQLDELMVRKNEGSGIGLSLVKSFVDAHGGDIYVESKVNEGSRFVVSLPIIEVEDEEMYDYCIDENSSIISSEIEFSDIYLP